MTYLVAACSSEEGLNLKQAGAFDNYDCYDEDDEKDGDEPEDIDPEGRYMISIRSGALEEKLSALSCIGEICGAVGKLVVPYLAKIVPQLVQLAIYPYPQVRQATMGVTRDVINLLAVNYPPAEECKSGVITPLHPDVEAMFFGQDGT